MKKFGLRLEWRECAFLKKFGWVLGDIYDIIIALSSWRKIRLRHLRRGSCIISISKKRRNISSVSYAWKSTGSREDTNFTLYCHDLHCRVCYRKLSYKNIKHGTNNNTVTSPTYLTCLPFYLIFVYIIFKTYIVINIVNNIIKIIMSIMIITALVLIGWIHTMPSATGHCGQK